MESLIKGMLQLYSELAAQLLRLRVERGRSRHGGAADVDLVGPLIDRLRECAAESASRTLDEPTPPAPDRPTAHETAKPSRHSGNGSMARAVPIPPPAPGKRVPALSRDPGPLGLQPPVGEQLKKQTFRYIAQAVDCARQGKIEAAEVYAAIAENALKLAAQYLPEQEYLSFKDEVMSRLARSGE